SVCDDRHGAAKTVLARSAGVTRRAPGIHLDPAGPLPGRVGPARTPSPPNRTPRRPLARPTAAAPRPDPRLAAGRPTVGRPCPGPRFRPARSRRVTPSTRRAPTSPPGRTRADPGGWEGVALMEPLVGVVIGLVCLVAGALGTFLIVRSQ